eukprot:2430280-Amphidinium_carterae.1
MGAKLCSNVPPKHIVCCYHWQHATEEKPLWPASMKWVSQPHSPSHALLATYARQPWTHSAISNFCGIRVRHCDRDVPLEPPKTK